jgi:hypothetical protein
MIGKYELEEFDKADNKTQKITEQFYNMLEND